MFDTDMTRSELFQKIWEAKQREFDEEFLLNMIQELEETGEIEPETEPGQDRALAEKLADKFRESCDSNETITMEMREEAINLIKGNAECDPEISSMLTMSTAHLSNKTRIMLSEIADRPLCTHPIMPVAAYRKGDCGWLIFCGMLGENVESDKLIMPDLYDCMLYAKSRGCDFLCVDTNGPIYRGLKKYQ